MTYQQYYLKWIMRNCSNCSKFRTISGCDLNCAVHNAYVLDIPLRQETRQRIGNKEYCAERTVN